MGGRGASSMLGNKGRGGTLPTQKAEAGQYKQIDISIFQGSKIKSMSQFEKLMQMQSLKRESAFLSDKNGNILAGAFGNSTSVGVYYEGSQAGLTLTHNHPGTYGGTFSTADISHLTNSKLAEIRAVAKEGTYSLKATSKANPMGLNRALNRDYNKIESKAYSNAKKVSRAGKSASQYNHERRKAYTDTISDWYKRNAKKYGYTYTTKAHNVV